MSDNRTTELLPCPFCGGEGKLYDDYSSERDEHRWQVWHVCDNGPEGESAGYGEVYHTSIDTPWFKSRDKAVEAWNTRAELGNGTCHIVKTWSDSDYVDDWRYRCSECGCNIPVNERDPETGDVINAANYCPNCGARVRKKVDE